MIPDIRTLMLLHFVMNLVSAGTMVAIWLQNRKRFAGISLWLADTVLQVVATALIALRGAIPAFVSIVVSNALILSGALIALVGLEHFVGRRGRHITNYILLVASVLLLAYYGMVDPNMVVREVIVAAMMGGICAQAYGLLLHRVSPALRGVTRITGVVFGCYAVVSFARLLLVIALPPNTSDFLQSGLVDAMALTLYIALRVCLTISVVLMVNKRLLREVQAQEEKFTTAFQSSPYAIILTGLDDGLIFEANDGFTDISGYQLPEVVGRTTLDLGLWARREDRMAMAEGLAEGRRAQGLEVQFRNKSGDMVTGLLSATIITVDGQRCVLSSVSDITELSRMKERLQVLAMHDALTGLPNRRLFCDRFASALAEAQRHGTAFAVVSLDLDRFKEVNDELGHDVGDSVLTAVASRLTGLSREGDTVARFGGDEFVLLLPDIGDKGVVTGAAQRILEGFRKPLAAGERELSLTVSMGIALYPEDGRGINDLLKSSDEALYRAKEGGRDSYQLSDKPA